jgi:putative FmdB family regulatory protein
VPTYQYACTACGEPLEVVQSFTDAPLTECPACGGALRKVFSAVGVVFKGSGFYKTDSRKSSADKKSDSGSGDAGTKSDTPAAKTESAPKTESKPASTSSTPAAKSA